MKNSYQVGEKFKLNGPYIGTVDGAEKHGIDDITGLVLEVVEVVCNPHMLPEYRLRGTHNDQWVTERRLDSATKIVG